MAEPFSPSAAAPAPVELGPLPPGWEQLWDPEARQPYFLDHNTKSTSVKEEAEEQRFSAFAAPRPTGLAAAGPASPGPCAMPLPPLTLSRAAQGSERSTAQAYCSVTP